MKGGEKGVLCVENILTHGNKTIPDTLLRIRRRYFIHIRLNSVIECIKTNVTVLAKWAVILHAKKPPSC